MRSWWSINRLRASVKLSRTLCHLATYSIYNRLSRTIDCLLVTRRRKGDMSESSTLGQAYMSTEKQTQHSPIGQDGNQFSPLGPGHMQRVLVLWRVGAYTGGIVKRYFA